MTVVLIPHTGGYYGLMKKICNTGDTQTVNHDFTRNSVSLCSCDLGFFFTYPLFLSCG